MQIGIISDTHDNWPALDKVCAHFGDESVNILIHCGDVCAPLTLGHLLDQYDGEIHLVLGNVDGDPFLMATRFADRKNLHQYGAERAEIELGDRKLAVQHYPSLARGLAATGAYDAVFFGHDHQQHTERRRVSGRDVLLANPGTLSAMGEPRTFLIYDSESNDVRLLEVDRL